MQFETLPGGERVNLPRPSIDTGMGLERIAAVLQGVHDNYDIDLFRALIRASADLTGVDPDGPQRASHRVIADHLRTSAFLVADGVLPSNEGRGYVLRRIMRRAMRHAQILGARDPLMWRLVPALTREMGQAYPELVRAEALISETLKLEETRFRSTLARGLAHSRGRDALARRRRRPERRDGVPALRHLRLPARSDPGRAARARALGRRRGVQRRHGAPARRSAPRLGGLGRSGDRGGLVRVARTRRRDRIPRLRDRDRRGRRSARSSRTAPRSGALGPGERGSLDPQPDAVLRRGRRPGRRYRRNRRARLSRAKSPTPARSSATSSSMMSRSSRARPGPEWRSSLKSIMPPARRPAPTIRRPTSCTKRCAWCSATMWRRRARWSRPSACASTSPIRNRSRGPNWKRLKTSPIAWCWRTPRSRRGLWGSTTRGRSERGLCSARNTATRCASSAWARSTTVTTTSAPFRSSSAAAPTSGAPATSASLPSSAIPRTPRGSGASRRRRAMRRANGSKPMLEALPISRRCSERPRARRPSGWKR